MFKAIARIEHKIGEKLFHFSCDGDSTLDHIKEALFQFTKNVAQIEDQVKAQQAAAQPQVVADPVVEPKAEDGSGI